MVCLPFILLRLTCYTCAQYGALHLQHSAPIKERKSSASVRSLTHYLETHTYKLRSPQYVYLKPSKPLVSINLLDLRLMTFEWALRNKHTVAFHNTRAHRHHVRSRIGKGIEPRRFIVRERGERIVGNAQEAAKLIDLLE